MHIKQTRAAMTSEEGKVRTQRQAVATLHLIVVTSSVIPYPKPVARQAHRNLTDLEKSSSLASQED